MKRQRGAIAKTIDNDALLVLGRKALAEQYPTELADHLYTFGNQMIFTVDHGNPAVVNQEGVGNIATENGKVAICFSYMMSIIELDIDLGELGGAVTETEIDLADGIRTFGSRLDVNHGIWFSRYDGS
ncbi:hypothetical protein ACTXIU_12995 [Glutamicibacter arilaitensis]|uniref:hypothetical protein n=1 Tax=Glutamicibacter arilaitensis TaxID=256701 RepID=UPI003FD1000E